MNHSEIKDDCSEIKNDCKHEWLVPSNNRTVCKRCGRDGWISLDTQSGHSKTQSGHSTESPSSSPTTIEVLEKTKQALRSIRNEMSYRIWQIERGDLNPVSANFINGEMYQAVRIADEALALTLTTENVSEKPQTEAPETAMEFLSRLGMDAKKWTDEFLKMKPDATDFGVMIGWFSNAIMAGYDRANWPKVFQLTAEGVTKKTDNEAPFTMSQYLTKEHLYSDMKKRIQELEAKLQTATDALEKIDLENEALENGSHEVYLIVRETLAKLRGGE